MAQNSGSTPASPNADDKPDPFGFMRQFSSASADVMSAWTDAWGTLMTNRMAPVSETVMKAMATPTAWPTALVPIMDEIRSALKLPKFADLPGLDMFQLPSPAPLLGLLQVSQDYAAMSLPIWVKASERFQGEVKAQQDKADGKELNAGELVDVWNNVLDLTMMEFNRSGEFAKAQQKLLHAAVQQRQEIGASVEKMAKLVNMPTRTEMTDIYQRLHDLTREVHALRRELRALRKPAPVADKPAPATDTAH